MIADLKPYAEYKESGLPWLGQVPGHWDVRRMKSSVMNVIEQTVEMSSDEVYIALEHVESWTGKARPQLGSNLFTGQVKRFRQGDVLFGKLRPYLAKVTRISNDGVCAGEFFVLRPADKAVSSAYLEYQLRAKHTIDVINGSTFGAKMPRADWQFCGNLPIPLPPPDEQAAIVRFLDWANGRLERAIRAKRKVIALLHEQKQAIIHRAVTRGLDPSVPLKPSGIPWLGEIPQHWEVWSFLRCTIERADYRGATPEKVDSGVFLVTAKNIRKGWIDYESSKEYVRSSDYAKIMRRGLPKKGDVLLTMEAPLGHFALIDREDIALAQRIVRFRLNAARLLPQFALLCLNSPYFQNQLAERATGSTAQGIKASKLPQLLVAFPSVSEQVVIVERVRCDCAPLDTVISRLEREINLLREYRTRLVADVVTGKLDVREAAARLPDEAPPDLAEDDAHLADDPNTSDAEVLA
jgi:type I restriction enzyme, S subunit